MSLFLLCDPSLGRIRRPVPFILCLLCLELDRLAATRRGVCVVCLLCVKYDAAAMASWWAYAIAAESQISHLVPLSTSRTSSMFAMESSTGGPVFTNFECTVTGSNPSQRNVSSNVPCVSFTKAS